MNAGVPLACPGTVSAPPEEKLLDDVVGLGERPQAGVTAVQEAAGVARQAVAGEPQPPPGLGVARHGPPQLPLQYGGRVVAHLPRSLLPGRRALRLSLSEPEAHPASVASNPSRTPRPSRPGTEKRGKQKVELIAAAPRLC
jgi:hypothetical protein